MPIQPRLLTQITRRRETSRVGDTVEIAGHIYRIVAMDAWTPKSDPANEIDAERGDMVVQYEVEYVAPAGPPAVAPKRATKVAAPKRAPKATST